MISYHRTIAIKKKDLISILLPVVIFFLAVGQRTTDAQSFLSNLRPLFTSGSSFVFFILVLKFVPKLDSFKHNWVLIAFLLLLGVSSLWSIDPTHTLKSSVWLFFSTLFSYFIVLKYSFRDFITLLLIGLSITIFFSVVLVFVSPGTAVHLNELHYGAWKGVYFHKSGLGREAALAAIIGFFFLKKPFNVFYYFVCFLIVWKTQSAVSLLVLAAVFFYSLGSTFLNVFKQFKYRKVLLGFLGLFSGIALLTMKYELIVGILGRSNTFGARLSIWAYSLINIQQKFFLGYGYNTFWLDDTLSDILSWNVPHAHNHFIDLFLDVGLLGFSLFIIVLIKYFLLVSKLDQKSNEFHVLFSSMLLIIGISLSEQTIYGSFNMIWIYFVAIVLYMENPNRLVYGQK